MMAGFATEVIHQLIEEHFDEATYLFEQLQDQLHQPILDREYLDDLETRLRRHLHALFYDADLFFSQPPEIFFTEESGRLQVALCIAWFQQRWRWVEHLFSAAEFSTANCQCLSLAIGYAESIQTQTSLAANWQQWLAEQDKHSANTAIVWTLILLPNAIEKPLYSDALMQLKQSPDAQATLFYHWADTLPSIKMPPVLFDLQRQCDEPKSLFLHLLHKHTNHVEAQLPAVEDAATRLELLTLMKPVEAEAALKNVLTQAPDANVFRLAGLSGFTGLITHLNQLRQQKPTALKAATALYYLTGLCPTQTWTMYELPEEESLFSGEQPLPIDTGLDVPLINPDCESWKHLPKLPANARYRLGSPMTAESLFDNLASSSNQHIRFNAYRQLRIEHGLHTSIDLHAPIALQQQQISTARQAFAEG